MTVAPAVHTLELEAALSWPDQPLKRLGLQLDQWQQQQTASTNTFALRSS
jgi:hypothetical protein